MFEFRRIIIQKRGRQGIIWGTLHRAKKEDYAPVQADIDRVHKNRGLILSEGVFREKHSPLSKNGRRLRHLMCGRLANQLHIQNAKTRGETYEKLAIRFPIDPMKADLSVEEIADRCDKAGIRFSTIEYILFFVWRDRQSRHRISKAINFLLEGPRLKLFGPIAEYFIGRVLNIRMRAIHESLAWRNEAAVSAIEQADPAKNFVLLYGSGHVDEIVRLLKEKGWKIRGA